MWRPSPGPEKRGGATVSKSVRSWTQAYPAAVTGCALLIRTTGKLDGIAGSLILAPTPNATGANHVLLGQARPALEIPIFTEEGGESRAARVGKGPAGNNVPCCQLWWHVSNVPMCHHFRGMASFRHTRLRHVKNVPPHRGKESGSDFPTGPKDSRRALHP